jgi:hypothetical protein
MKIVDFNKAKKYEDIAIISFLFFLTFSVAGYFSTLGIDPHHDGIMFKPAIDFAEGKILFKESFTQYGALTTILQGVSLILFGKYLIVIKLLTALFYSLIATLLYLIWKNVIPKYLALISCLIWLLLAPYFVWPFLAWSSVYALFFQMLSLYLLILFIKKSKKYLLFMSGFSAALCFWCRQPVGIFLICAITIFIIVYCQYKRDYLKSKIITIVSPMFGAIVCTSLFIFWLLINGAIYDWYLQSIKAIYLFASSHSISLLSTSSPGASTSSPATSTSSPGALTSSPGALTNSPATSTSSPATSTSSPGALTSSPGTSTSSPGALTSSPGISTISPGIFKVINNVFLPFYVGRIQATAQIALVRIVWTIIPIINIIIFLALIKSLKSNQRNPNNEIIMAILIISFASLLQNYPIPCIRHMYWAETPMIGMVIYGYREIINKKSINKKSMLLILLIFITFSPDMIFRVYQGYEKIKKYNVSFEYPPVLLGIKSYSDDVTLQKKIAKKISEYYNKSGSAGIINLTGDALYLTYIKDNKYFHKIYINWLNNLYPDYCEKLNKKIVNDRPIILKSIKDQAIPGYITAVRFEIPKFELLYPCENYTTKVDGEYPYKNCK